jgi:tRNA A37 methylthiotransferase MiaB
MLMKNYFIHTTGCLLRYLDAERFRRYFLINGHNVVKDPTEADYIIYLTCGTGKKWGELSYKMIQEFQKYNAELIVAGCFPKIFPNKLNEIFNGKTINTKDLNQNPSKIDRLFPDIKIKLKDIDDQNTITFQNINNENFPEKIKRMISTIKFQKNIVNNKKEFIFMTVLTIIENLPIDLEKLFFKILFNKKSYAYYIFYNASDYNLRVSWGCTGNCSYCGIKKAVGPHVSKPLDYCIDEFKRGLQKGYKNFTIVGDDTGAYGLDNGSNFPELLYKITELEGDYKITIRDLNPHWVVKYIKDLEKIVKTGKIQLVQCSFQSGSKRILKLMNRYNDVEKIKNAYIRLKKAYPPLLLGPQIIIGFPTETIEDVKKTLSFIKEINFNSGQIFSFSCIPDTKAAKIKPKVTHSELQTRIKYINQFLKKEGYYTKWLIDGGMFYKKII